MPLIYTSQPGDFKCPKCNTGLEVEDWDTEYGEPILYTDITIFCPKCEYPFILYVEQTLHYQIRPVGKRS